MMMRMSSATRTTGSSSSSTTSATADDEPWSIFALTENLTNLYVDPSKLLNYMSLDESNVGMNNFRSKKQPVAGSNLNPLFLMKQKQQQQQAELSSADVAKARWKSAASRVKFLTDPWAEFDIDSLQAEHCIRHRYNAIKKEWIKDECVVKIESKQFACGAMRGCYRLKKLSNVVYKESWQHASNYVAKSYLDSEGVPRERYFDDVKLQMEAKLWAEIFNRYNPPKKIDMFQVSVLEFKDRPGSPLYHLEHYIEGNYIKYNSNSGFVESDEAHLRLTPQAFSHFTFECSRHDLIVVDIQGVADLYTDPQIHTASGNEYGDGNLGLKGFALFFSSHVCNTVCKKLGLTQFDLAPSELKQHEKLISSMQKCAQTVSRGCEELLVGSPSNIGEYIRYRYRCRSNTSFCSDDNMSSTNELPNIEETEGYDEDDECSSSFVPSPNSCSSPTQPGIPIPAQRMASNDSGIGTSYHNGHHVTSPRSINNSMNSNVAAAAMAATPISRRTSRVRTESSCLDSAFSMDEAVNYFNQIDARQMFKPRPSGGNGQVNPLSTQYDMIIVDTEDLIGTSYEDMASRTLISEEESNLGKIHLELAKYHEMGRFVADQNSDEFDTEAAFFHLKQAADLGIKEAMINLAKIYLDLPRDMLASYHVESGDSSVSLGFNYMLKCAEKADKQAMFHVAKAFDTGLNLPRVYATDWKKAAHYYKRVLDLMDEESQLQQQLDESVEDSGYYSEGADTCEPCYQIMARMAEMHLKGGPGLESDPGKAYELYNEAGERATAKGKGRLANKYYMLAEEASSMCD